MDNQKEIDELKQILLDLPITLDSAYSDAKALIEMGYRKQSQEQKLDERDTLAIAQEVFERWYQGTKNTPDKKAKFEGNVYRSCIHVAEYIIQTFGTPQRKVSVEEIWEVMKNSWDFESGNDRDERFYPIAQAIYNLIEGKG